MRTPQRPALTIQEFGENTDGSAVPELHAGSGPRTITGFSATLSAFAKEAFRPDFSAFTPELAKPPRQRPGRRHRHERLDQRPLGISHITTRHPTVLSGHYMIRTRYRP